MDSPLVLLQRKRPISHLRISRGHENVRSSNLRMESYHGNTSTNESSSAPQGDSDGHRNSLVRIGKRFKAHSHQDLFEAPYLDNGYDEISIPAKYSRPMGSLGRTNSSVAASTQCMRNTASWEHLPSERVQYSTNVDEQKFDVSQSQPRSNPRTYCLNPKSEKRHIPLVHSHTSSNLGSVRLGAPNVTLGEYSFFLCPVPGCGKQYSFKSSLRRHMRIHTGDNLESCPYCGKKLCDKATLKSHIRMHTGERPFKCPHCERTFSQRGNMNRHVANYHSHQTSR